PAKLQLDGPKDGFLDHLFINPSRKEVNDSSPAKRAIVQAVSSSAVNRLLGGGYDSDISDRDSTSDAVLRPPDSHSCTGAGAAGCGDAGIYRGAHRGSRRQPVLQRDGDAAHHEAQR